MSYLIVLSNKMDRFTTLLICGAVLLFLWVTVLGLIFFDLWAGVRKAKKVEVYSTSQGYRGTDHRGGCGGL